MARKMVISVLFISIFICPSGRTQDSQAPVRQETISARPPEKNQRGFGSPAEDIRPNLGFYTVDPLYDPNAVLGWAKES